MIACLRDSSSSTIKIGRSFAAKSFPQSQQILRICVGKAAETVALTYSRVNLPWSKPESAAYAAWQGRATELAVRRLTQSGYGIRPGVR